MPIKFRFRWIPFVAAMLAVVLGIELGRWQTRRAHEKEALEAAMATRAAQAPIDINRVMPTAAQADFHRIRVTGEFLRDWPVYLDNRQYNGIPGFYVLMPLKIAGSHHYILVARGWTQRNFEDRTRLPKVPTPTGDITVEGVARREPARLLQLGTDTPLRPGALRENLTVAEFARASGLDLLPFLIDQTSNTGDKLVRDWPRPSAGIERNRGYAVQWYALAAMAFLFYVVTGFRRGSKQAEGPK